MSVPFSAFSSEPESEHSLPFGTQLLGLLRDEHGAPLLRQLYYSPEQLLCGQWFGNLTSESVIAGGKACLLGMQQVRPALVLNDKSVATGDWTEAMDWLEYEWLPLAQQYGMRAFAYVFSPDMHNQLAALEFFTRVRPHVAIKLFYDGDTAHAWLLRHL
jgi:hypothetical protein